MAIYKYLDCSTAHITKRDSTILEECGAMEDVAEKVVLDYGYGFVVFVPSDKDYLKGYLVEAEKRGLSKHFQRLIKHAYNKKCLKLVLDSDGDKLRGFKQFDW